VCLDNTYLLTASVYIHLNPVRAGLAAQATAYKWSSCTLYCREATQSFVDPEQVLSLIHPQKNISKKHYAELVRQGGDHQPENALEQEGAIETFCSKLSKLFPKLYNKVARENRSQEDKAEDILELTDLENLVQVYQHGELSEPESREARKYLVEQLLARGFKKTQIAERLGVSRQTVYNILRLA
jgi:putative transposase